MIGQILGFNLHWWETAMLVSLGFAAIAAVAVGVATTIVVVLTRQSLRESEAALDRYKSEANLEITRANASAASATENAAKANFEAQTAKLETERIKEQLAWRDISPLQAQTIKSVLLNTNLQVTISWIAGDPEGSAYAHSLATALQAAGIQISAFAPMGMLGNEPRDVSISGSEGKEIDLLSNAFRQAGVGPLSAKLDNRKPDGTKYYTHVFVGYRARPGLAGK